MNGSSCKFSTCNTFEERFEQVLASCVDFSAVLQATGSPSSASSSSSSPSRALRAAAAGDMFSHSDEICQHIERCAVVTGIKLCFAFVAVTESPCLWYAAVSCVRPYSSQPCGNRLAKLTLHSNVGPFRILHLPACGHFRFASWLRLVLQPSHVSGYLCSHCMRILLQLCWGSLIHRHSRRHSSNALCSLICSMSYIAGSSRRACLRGHRNSNIMM